MVNFGNKGPDGERRPRPPFSEGDNMWPLTEVHLALKNDDFENDQDDFVLPPRKDDESDVTRSALGPRLPL